MLLFLKTVNMLSYLAKGTLNVIKNLEMGNVLANFVHAMANTREKQFKRGKILFGFRGFSSLLWGGCGRTK
jgi:hypothetical protein